MMFCRGGIHGNKALPEKQDEADPTAPGSRDLLALAIVMVPEGRAFRTRPSSRMRVPLSAIRKSDAPP